MENELPLNHRFIFGCFSCNSHTRECQHSSKQNIYIKEKKGDQNKIESFDALFQIFNFWCREHRYKNFCWSVAISENSNFKRQYSQNLQLEQMLAEQYVQRKYFEQKDVQFFKSFSLFLHLITKKVQTLDYIWNHLSIHICM